MDEFDEAELTNFNKCSLAIARKDWAVRDRMIEEEMPDIVGLRQEQFDDLMEDLDRNLEACVVIFGSNGCVWCYHAFEAFQPFAKEGFPVFKVECETESPELASRFRIKAFPTIMMFERGYLLDVYSGVRTRDEVEPWINRSRERIARMKAKKNLKEEMRAKPVCDESSGQCVVSDAKPS